MLCSTEVEVELVSLATIPLLRVQLLTFTLMFVFSGGSLGRFIQRKLATFNLWQDPFHKVKEGVQLGVSLCDKWVSTCEKLTDQYWKRDPIHPWKGNKFVPENLSCLSKRLQEVKILFLLNLKMHPKDTRFQPQTFYRNVTVKRVTYIITHCPHCFHLCSHNSLSLPDSLWKVLTLRTIHEQLIRLLSSGEQQELRTKSAFSPFTGIDPLQYNPYTEPQWQAAMAQYEKGELYCMHITSVTGCHRTVWKWWMYPNTEPLGRLLYYIMKDVIW